MSSWDLIIAIMPIITPYNIKKFYDKVRSKGEDRFCDITKKVV